MPVQAVNPARARWTQSDSYAHTLRAPDGEILGRVERVGGHWEGETVLSPEPRIAATLEAAKKLVMSEYIKLKYRRQRTLVTWGGPHRPVLRWEHGEFAGVHVLKKGKKMLGYVWGDGGEWYPQIVHTGRDIMLTRRFTRDAAKAAVEEALKKAPGVRNLEAVEEMRRANPGEAANPRPRPGTPTLTISYRRNPEKLWGWRRQTPGVYVFVQDAKDLPFAWVRKGRGGWSVETNRGDKPAPMPTLAEAKAWASGRYAYWHYPKWNPGEAWHRREGEWFLGKLEEAKRVGASAEIRGFHEGAMRAHRASAVVSGSLRMPNPLPTVGRCPVHGVRIRIGPKAKEVHCPAGHWLNIPVE